ncbi:class I SAM-dependent methyltransferase [Aspergillus homomorphus CBS 101889]|uniref:S-adenosyl-L-methionine-dependent methyltransferase n=1 Tax=Aspergillus homomorphus (strain CBS 101889) TaxID=1450537 RepID=A0A395I9C7_ASPHC|nr:S-adenosyl-L-methionine-dependent methyltransferase [Aspergillus homomorphus CBS 101889]RAL14744.1 S-adenosyl-L-methionine-dependent methyltransferase [Aspergillus homomorphus CBS 101889]
MAHCESHHPIAVDVNEYTQSLTGTCSSTTSLSSSVLKYEYRHGRRYHAYQSGSYPFPNDQPEQDRLDIIHHVFYRLLNDRLFLAPINPAGKRMLDIGTGTGLWAIQMADENPSIAQITGLDLSPIQSSWVPPNVDFVVDDVEEDWVESKPYDYIHCRYMAGSIRDWPRLIRQCYDNLVPGGWLELQESVNTLYSEDGSLKSDSWMVKMMEGLIDGGARVGQTLDPALSFEGWVRDAGFTNVQVHKFKLPIGPWPKDSRLKECGSLMQINFVEGVEGFTAQLFIDVLGWKPEDVDALNAGVRAESLKGMAHPIFDFLVVAAQKPL